MTLQPLSLSDFGPVLSTRERGSEAAERLLRMLGEGTVVVSFANVEVATPSYLDELLSRLRGALEAKPEAIVIVTEINPDISESLKLVLDNRNMVLAKLADSKIELIGGNRQLQETMAAASALGTFKATELADQLAVKLPNLHQRLKALTDAGALGRRIDETAERGVRYEFEAPDSKRPGPKRRRTSTSSKPKKLVLSRSK